MLIFSQCGHRLPGAGVFEVAEGFKFCVALLLVDSESDLEVLWYRDSDFAGRTFDVAYNKLSGSFPDKLFSSATGLVYVTRGAARARLPSLSCDHALRDGMRALCWVRTLQVTSNSFTGTISSGISALNQLYSLDLSYNQFSGSIPGGVSALTGLRSVPTSAEASSSI